MQHFLRESGLLVNGGSMLLGSVPHSRAHIRWTTSSTRLIQCTTSDRATNLGLHSQVEYYQNNLADSRQDNSPSVGTLFKDVKSRRLFRQKLFNTCVYNLCHDTYTRMKCAYMGGHGSTQNVQSNLLSYMLLSACDVSGSPRLAIA